MKKNALDRGIFQRQLDRKTTGDSLEHEKKILKLQDELKDHLIIKDAGLTVYTKGELSKGCQSCKDGKWLCIFSGFRCNLTCLHCPQNNTVLEDKPDAFCGVRIRDYKTLLDLCGKEHCRGVGYSGGEPFMYLDKIYDFAAFLSKKHPYIYQWIYTNGVLVNEQSFKRLADNGVKEIRFDLLATGFSEAVLRKLPIARKYFERLTVEVPSLPETVKNLIEKKILLRLEEYGVDQINLSEMLVTEHNLKNFPNEPIYKYTSMYFSTMSHVSSRFLTYEIIKYAVKNRVKMVINDCSNDTKNLQIIKRSLNPLLSKMQLSYKGIV